MSTSGVAAWSVGLETAYAAGLLGAATQTSRIASVRFALQFLHPAQRVTREVLSIASAALVCSALASITALWLPWGSPDRPTDHLVLAAGVTALHMGAVGALLCRANLSPLHTALALLGACWLLPSVLPATPMRILLDPSLHLDHWKDGVTMASYLADMMPAAALTLAAGLLPDSSSP